jgi:TP53 regulating kinase and related kinases
MGLIGDEIAKMHRADIIHGDLTTSNMMLRHPLSFKSLPAALHPTELARIAFSFSLQESKRILRAGSNRLWTGLSIVFGGR